MHEKDQRYLIALKAIEGIGESTLNKLLDYFTDAKAVFEANSATLKQAGLSPRFHHAIRAFNFKQIQPTLDWLAVDNHYLIESKSPFYPELLRQIHTPPAALFAIGNPALLATPQIAVVGARKPTPQGLRNTRSFCEALAVQGFTITSGMALGIDGEAHRSALDTGGATIAVCGTGLGRIYPAQHRELAHLIAHKGLLVSEYLPTARHHSGSFQQRNRIIAGLSLGCLVVEAAHKSGSLITARHAMEEGREVFAVPGTIHSPLSQGCHQLIQQGAKLTASLEDILDDLPAAGIHQLHPPVDESRPPLDDEASKILDCIDFEVTPLDTIVTRSQLTVTATTN